MPRSVKFCGLPENRRLGAGSFRIDLNSCHKRPRSPMRTEISIKTEEIYLTKKQLFCLAS